MTRAIVSRRRARSRMAFVLEVAAGGLGLLLFFVGLVWYYAVLEAILTPRPCEPACVAIQHGNQR